MTNKWFFTSSAPLLSTSDLTFAFSKVELFYAMRVHDQYFIEAKEDPESL